MVDWINVAGDKVCAVGIGAGDEQGRNPHHISSEPRRYQMLDGRLGGDEDLAAHMSAFLFGGQLIFKVNPCCTGFYHTLHKLEHIEWATKTGFGIGDDRGKPVNAIFPFGMVNLIGSLQCLVNTFDDMRHTVGRIEALVGIHLSGQIRIRGHLPAAQVDRLQASPDLLNGLIARQCTQSRHIGLGAQQMPESLCAHACQCMLNLD